MVDRIVVVNGHPDARPERLCSALVDAYVRGAHRAGHEVRRIDVGELEFPLIRSEADFQDAAPPATVRHAQEALLWANHLVIIYPLWLGSAPALLKGFLEQVFRYGFAISPPGERMRGLLDGRSARIVVTMGMPAPIFRWVFGAFGARCLERGLLWVSGVKPIRRTILGGVGAADEKTRNGWLRKLEALGAAAN